MGDGARSRVDARVSRATAGATPKGQQTRALILKTALGLFREHGYDATTMRMIADRADVALGNAYYYFRSKEHLIQAFYDQVTDSHAAAARDILGRETDLKARLRGVVAAAVAMMEPYHRFSGSLFRSAADPRSPLSPFSPESRSARRKGIALFAEVLDGSSARVPADLRAELPELLWLYQMGVILFWIHDRSPGHRRTNQLIERSSELVARAIALAGFPVLRPLRRTALRLMADLREEIVEQ